MKNKKLLSVAVILASLIISTSCAGSLSKLELGEPSAGRIYLYGEHHGIERILAKELELWGEYYHNEGMRHLFIEWPYYTAEYLNMWLKAEDDEILDALYKDWAGSMGHAQNTKDFFKRIKTEYPETIFHGTDVGHQYNSTGRRYLAYLKENGMEGTEQYTLAREAVKQGERYYKRTNGDHVYREDKMAENFIREFDKLNGESVMGIYGSAHTGIEGIVFFTKNYPCMANWLYQRYGDKLYSEDISLLRFDNEPLRIDKLIVSGREYEASYFGEKDITSYKQGYIKCKFWRLENAYDDYKDIPISYSTIMPYEEYIMLVEIGQIFVIDFEKPDGTIDRMYFRSEGNESNGKPVTDMFIIE